MVRHQAKLEQPLRALVNNGGRVFISTVAEVTFYGADLAGNDVQAGERSASASPITGTRSKERRSQTGKGISLMNKNH